MRWERVETSGGLLLRRIDRADADGVFAVHRDPVVYRHDPHETHPDVAHTRTFLAPMIGHWERHGFGYWTVLVPGEDWPGGVLGPLPQDGGRRIAGLGGLANHEVAGRAVLNVYVRFAAALQGRGLARAVLENTAAIAPLVGPGRDVVVRTRPANVAMRRVAERAGFRDEGLEPGDDDMQLLRLPAHPADENRRG